MFSDIYSLPVCAADDNLKGQVKIIKRFVAVVE